MCISEGKWATELQHTSYARNQHYAATGLASFPKEMTAFFKRNLCFRIPYFLEKSNLSLSHKSN